MSSTFIMEKYAVVVAGGLGLRMGNSLPKQFILLKGKPVLWYTLTAFLEAYDDLEIIVVLPPQHQEMGLAIIHTTHSPERIAIAPGGETRFDSVKNGLQQIQKSGIVFVHDGVRCLITPKLIRKCYEATLRKGNAIPSMPVTDTLRLTIGDRNEWVDRDKIRSIQTPQTFHADTLITAFEQAYRPSFTDEANVVAQLGVALHLIEGECQNIKITHPLDLLIAEKILEERAKGR